MRTATAGYWAPMPRRVTGRLTTPKLAHKRGLARASILARHPPTEDFSLAETSISAIHAAFRSTGSLRSRSLSKPDGSLTGSLTGHPPREPGSPGAREPDGTPTASPGSLTGHPPRQTAPSSQRIFSTQPAAGDRAPRRPSATEITGWGTRPDKNRTRHARPELSADALIRRRA